MNLVEKYLIREKNNNKNYRFYVVAQNKIQSGWEEKEDAEDMLGDMPPKFGKGKVITKAGLKKFNLNPDNNNDWLKG